VVIDLATQPGTPATSLAPKLTVNKLDINVDPKHVDIKLHGGLVTKIASIVIPLIKNSVIPGVIKQVQETATTLIDTTLDDDLKLYGSQITLPGTDVVIDYGQVDGSPSAKNSVLSLMFNGTTFEAGTPSKYQPVKFDAFDPKGKQIQVHLADAVLNSAFQSLHETAGELELTQLLDKLNVTIKTDDFENVIPELVTKYGEGQRVDITLSLTEEAHSAFSPAGQYLNGSASIKMIVQGETALKGTFNSANFNASLHSENGKVFGKISSNFIGSLEDFETTLGFTAEQLQLRLQ